MLAHNAPHDAGYSRTAKMLHTGPMFQPRGTRAKRSSSLPQVRVDDEELEAIRWMQRRLSAKYGKDLSISDVMRLAAAHLYEAEQAAAAAESDHAKPAP